MKNTSQRLVYFAAAFFGGLALLAVLLSLFTFLPQFVASPRQTAMPTPWVVAIIDDEPIYIDDWQRAMALDQVMSELVGQVMPSSEETLYRLINERLVLRAAEKAGLSEAGQAQAEDWLRFFLARWRIEEATLMEALSRVGLTRDDLIGEMVPRLLQVQRAVDELAPAEDEEAWVADLHRLAKVDLLESLSPTAPLDLPMPTKVLTPQASELMAQSTQNALSLSTGPLVGELALDFSLETIDGSVVRLSDLRGLPVLLNFWAPWCTTCREELPMLQALDTDALVVLGIAVREPPDKVTAFAMDLGLELPLLVDQNGRTSDAYRVRGLPTSLLVDREGVIVARHVGPLDREILDIYLSSLLTIPPHPTSAP
jgi:cytochrome c biogenesis protein CcmG/thiol:disulfide interchange protein DsbE